MAVGVSYEGETIFRANVGFRDVQKQLAPDSETVYGIGSITKCFTASAIGILVAEGSLEWTTPIKNILPDFNSSSAVASEYMTVVDLLAHRTAIATSNNWLYGAGGALLLDKHQTMSAYNSLQPIGSFRNRYDYSNWNYAVLGEVIEKVTGRSYGTFIKEKILDPLHMNRSSASHISDNDENLALPYPILDDLSPYALPMPASEDGKLMAPAQAIQSTVDDLLKYAYSLITTYRDELEPDNQTRSEHPPKNVVKQLTAHNQRGSPSMLQKAYCLGMHRHQLPNKFDGLGCNSQFVKEMPTLRPGGDARLILQYGGSLAGYTTFIALVPEINACIVVLVNSIGLGDPAGWINQLIIEAVIDTPTPNDYVKLAEEAAKNHATTVDRMWSRLKDTRKDIPMPRSLQDYVGKYRSPTQDFFIDVKTKVKEDNTTQLVLKFQGLDSQTWNLSHWEADTFLALKTFNDWAKRAMFTFGNENFFRFGFQADGAGHVARLYWKLDVNVPADNQFFVKEGIHEESSIQRPVLKSWWVFVRSYIINFFLRLS